MNEVEKQFVGQVKNLVDNNNIEGLVKAYQVSQEIKDKAMQIAEKLTEISTLSTCEIFNMLAAYMLACAMAVKEGYPIDQSLWLEHTLQGEQPLSFHSDNEVSSSPSEVQG